MAVLTWSWFGDYLKEVTVPMRKGPRDKPRQFKTGTVIMGSNRWVDCGHVL